MTCSTVLKPHLQRGKKVASCWFTAFILICQYDKTLGFNFKFSVRVYRFLNGTVKNRPKHTCYGELDSWGIPNSVTSGAQGTEVVRVTSCHLWFCGLNDSGIHLQLGWLGTAFSEKSRVRLSLSQLWICSKIPQMLYCCAPKLLKGRSKYPLIPVLFLVICNRLASILWNVVPLARGFNLQTYSVKLLGYG